MKRIFFILFLALLCVHCKSEQSNRVSVKGRSIFVNDSIYSIKGVCYHPVPKGSDNIRSFQNLSQDLALMVEAEIIGESIIEKRSLRRNHWKENHREEIIEERGIWEASGRHPGGIHRRFSPQA